MVKPRQITRHVTVTLLPLADKVYGCERCHRRLRAGERVTFYRAGRDVVFVRHVGRKCPVVYNPHPFQRSPR